MIRHLNTVWLALGITILIMLALNPQLLDRQVIAGYLETLGPMALSVYILMSLTRAALLIPATPFVLAGGIVFPEIPGVVLLVSYTGIVVGAYLVYSFPSFGSYDELLEEKFPDKIALLKRKMQSRHVYWFIMGWSAFPLVPTDAVCYVAGIARISAVKTAAAVLIGEIPIVIIYVFVGAELGEWLRA